MASINDWTLKKIKETVGWVGRNCICKWGCLTFSILQLVSLLITRLSSLFHLLRLTGMRGFNEISCQREGGWLEQISFMACLDGGRVEGSRVQLAKKKIILY